MLKTEFLGLNYHPNPATNEDEVDAEKYFNENYFTIDANAKKMREKVDYLSKNAPWNTTSGESIHIQDSAEWDENKLSLSGNMKQEKRSGKNKFRIPESSTSNGVTLTNNGDGSFTLNGTTTGVAIFNATLNKPLEIGTYTISYKSSVALGNSFFLRVRDENMILVNSANPASQVIGNNSTHNAATYPASVESAIVAINLTQAGVTYNNVVIYPQLEEGTVATDWEQYGAMPSTEFPSMPLVCSGVQKIRQFGKQLFNKNSIKSGYTFTATGDVVPLTNAFIQEEYIQVDSLEDYTLATTSNYTTTTDYRLIICEYDNKKTFIKRTLKTSRTCTITTESKTTYVRICASTITLDELQLEKGIVATDCEPYTEEINTLDLGTTELCAITDANGTVVAQDRAVYRNGKWQWEKNVGKYVFNGTESWSVDVKQSGCNYYSFFTKPGTIKAYSNIVANLFKEDDTIYATDNLGIYVNYVGAVRIKNGVSTTVAELKAWLSTNNLIAYYVLATPTYTDCTADQSAILDKLYNNFKLQKGVNNIIVETDNGVGIELDLSYMQDNILKNSYKANEVNTGKKWIDGKDIYRKVVKVTDLSSGNNRIAHNINNLNELVDIRGTGNWNGNWQTIPRLVTDAASTFGLGLGDINDTKFLIQVGTTYTNFTKAYIIIEYTKTV